MDTAELGCEGRVGCFFQCRLCALFDIYPDAVEPASVPGRGNVARYSLAAAVGGPGRLDSGVSAARSTSSSTVICPGAHNSKSVGRPLRG